MNLRGLILDWDGVWTDGRKRPDGHSEFSEHDTMGLNLVRFAHYLFEGELLRVAIVTGERNLTAEFVALREHLDHFFYYARDKTKAKPILEAQWQLPAERWGFLFDDVLDFGLASMVGYRCMVRWPAAERTRNLAQIKGLVDQWIDPPSPIRQWCESYLSEMGWLERAVEERQANSLTYQAFWALRNTIEPEIIDLSA